MNKYYVVSEYIIEHYDLISKVHKELPTNLTHKFQHVTVSELAKAHNLTIFDYALPIGWVKEFQNLTGFSPVGHFVYSYDNNKYGEPYPLTIEGEVAYKIYLHLRG